MTETIESPASPRARVVAFVLLLLPFAALLAVAGSNERASWPDLLPREATILMQAGSLAEDHDLAYSRLDFDRLLLGWRGNPPDLELATGGDGRRITFDYPPIYAAWLAPFLALAPERGIAFANLALLLLAAVLAARALAARLGPWTPAMMAVWLFAAAVFAGVFRADGDVFVLSLTLLAAAFWLDGGPRAERLALVAGLLLAPVLLAEPVALLAAPLFGWRSGASPRRWKQLLAGLLGGLLLLVLVQWWNGGGLGLGTTSSFKFTPATGYPAVDFPPTSWAQEVQQLKALHWDEAPRLSFGFEPRLLAWNLAYFLFGSQLGLLPYFLPLALLLVLRPRQLGLALGLLIVWQLLAHGFNFWGGPGPLGDRLLYPLYGAAILALPGIGEKLGPLRGRRAAWALALPLVLAAPFLHRLWASPAAWPFAKAAYAQQSPIARALLPHEASQRWLPGGAVEELNGVWIAALDENSWVEKRNGRLGIAGDHAAFLVGSGTRLAALSLELGDGAPSEIALRGGKLGDRLLRPSGGIGFRVVPELWRRHAMWWSPLPMYLYRLEIELPAGRLGDTYLELMPEWPAGETK